MSDTTICTAGHLSLDGCTCDPGPKARKVSAGVWHYRGWTISQDDFGNGWTAYSENYDADYQCEEDGFVDNGEKVTGSSIEACCDEIDEWISEVEEAEAAEHRANHDEAA
jgi:hypothetical protein